MHNSLFIVVRIRLTLLKSISYFIIFDKTDRYVCDPSTSATFENVYVYTDEVICGVI